jgi:acyl-CoA thioesterase FadM
MRNKPWRREGRFYRFQYELQPRYVDMDTERHVNNVAVLALHAEARMRMQLSLFGTAAWLSKTAMLRTAGMETDFLRITHYPFPVQGGVSLIAIDEHEYTLASALFQDGACVGVQECRIGAWQGGKRVALPEEVRSRLLAHGTAPEADTVTDGNAPEDMSTCPCSFELTQRFGDLDADGYLSEIAVARFMEQGRSHLLRGVLRDAGIDLRNGPLGMLVASVKIRFADHRAPHGNIRLAGGVSRIGRSSVDLRVAVFDRDGCVAVADNVMVFIARETGRPVPISAALLARLEKLDCRETRAVG